MAVRPRALLALLACATGLAGCGDARESPEPRATTERPAAAAPVTLAARLPVHLDAFARIAAAHDGTRAAGTPGGAASERHVEQALRAAGFTVRRQRVRFDQFVERRPPLLRRGGRTFRAPAEVRTLTFSATGTVAGRVRRVTGLGCQAADHRVLRRGEIALVTRGTCPLRTKALLAARAGAGAVLIANTPAARPGGRGTFTGTLGSPGVRVPVVGVGAAAAVALAGGDVTLRVDARSGRLSAENVVGELAGGDPDRVVMVGAHLDSVGAGPGLNDNGSGSAAVLALAERAAAMPRDGATLRVGFWAAEEVGLVGSRAHVAGLSAAERRAIRAYVNLDMVGSPNGAPFVYDSGNAVEAALRAGVTAAGRRPEPTDIGDASDHAPFRRAGIPIGGVYSGAGERKSAAIAERHGGEAGAPYDRCYHRACDRRPGVDVELALDLAEATESALRALG